MLACVCQPTDGGIFSRSPVPLGAPPLQSNGAVPKRSRALEKHSVITTEPNPKTIHKHQETYKKTKHVANRITKRTGRSDAFDTASVSGESLSLSVNNESNDKALEVAKPKEFPLANINCLSTRNKSETKQETIGCETRNTSIEKCNDLRKRFTQCSKFYWPTVSNSTTTYCLDLTFHISPNSGWKVMNFIIA
ncbi:uncharacterized protein LOC116167111 [Photinus pyralis]|uniref:uncharacterized protein LOC116167111 n=1 Tax=Photinus pyralis TaxID=7054 RepID=UPI00126709AB|nr:uncharacterized protein LOC116167111 [Photinus pyralis]